MATSIPDPKVPNSQGTWVDIDDSQDRDPAFPFSPPQWGRDVAEGFAKRDCIELSDDHWQVIRALQEYYGKHQSGHFNVRELHDAMDEKFHDRGGYRYLYRLFPGGPIAQGCRIAGLEPPSGSIDLGFGSVV
jgi:tRNA 2-thiouridine synthesizing protein E